MNLLFILTKSLKELCTGELAESKNLIDDLQFGF